MDVDKIMVGERIKSIRLQMRITEREFGRLFDNPAANSLVSRWEIGINLPNASRLGEIASFGGMTVDDLMHGKRDSISAFTMDDLINEINRRLTSDEDIH